MVASVLEGCAHGKVASGNGGRGVAEQGLAAVGDRTKPGAAVDGGAVVVVVADLCLARVDGGADADHHLGGPGLAVERSLDLEGSADRVGGAGEDGEGRIA